MNSESTEKPTTDSQPSTKLENHNLIVGVSIAVVVTVFCLFFVMGFASAWLKSEGDFTALLIRGVKLGVSGSLGVLSIGLSAKFWERLSVPPWLPLSACFAVGFFVMNGVGEFLDGRYDTILPKAGSGFLAGCLAGLGIFWAQKKGLVPRQIINAGRKQCNAQTSEDLQR